MVTLGRQCRGVSLGIVRVNDEIVERMSLGRSLEGDAVDARTRLASGFRAHQHGEQISGADLAFETASVKRHPVDAANARRSLPAPLLNCLFQPLEFDGQEEFIVLLMLINRPGTVSNRIGYPRNKTFPISIVKRIVKRCCFTPARTA